MDATTWKNAVDHPFFIIYDLAIGGSFPDAFGGGPSPPVGSGGRAPAAPHPLVSRRPATTLDRTASSS
nr:hypothetical protein [Catenulispora acidiphila]